MMKKTLALLSMLTFSAVAGCASIGARSSNTETSIYPGVKNDIYFLCNPGEADYPILQPLNIIDLPFSAIFDSALLPYDLYRCLSYCE